MGKIIEMTCAISLTDKEKKMVLNFLNSSLMNNPLVKEIKNKNKDD